MGNYNFTEVTDMIKERPTTDPDVVVVVRKDNQIINGTGNVLKGLAPALGKGALGYMKLGDK